MKLLTKIRMSMVLLIFTTSWFIYWTQMASNMRQVERETTRHRRGALNGSAVVKLNERLAYDFDEKLVGYNFVRPSFQYLIEPRNVHRRSCRNGLPPKTTWCMVNFVKSKANHTEHRNDLRRMWAHKVYVNGSRFDTVFVVGMSRNITTETELRMEQKIHGDILQYDGPDDYKYVPLKTLAGMQWAVDHLSRDHYYSSGDDDVMVVVERLHKVMSQYINISTLHDWAEFPIICTYRTMDFTRPYRNSSGRYKQWYIAKSEYKWPFYPRGCFGGFYSTSVRVVKLLLDAARTTPYLRVDDVWITGVLRLKLGMPDTMVIEPTEKIAFHGVGQHVSNIDREKLEAKNRTSKALLKFINVMPNMEA